jgi:hypothetical protein
MIYSPDHKFLLIKNIKVGGTSLEVELSKVLPDNAIVTPIDPINSQHFPRNHNYEFYNHMPLVQIRKKINLEKTKSYVVVRNPYDTVLSDFFYKLQIQNTKINTYKMKEEEFLKSDIDLYFKNYFLSGTHKLYTENKKIAVDKVLFYENGIENEINKILLVHKINPITIKTFEKKHRPPWANHKNVFDKEQIEVINKEWAWEFKNLGYSLI